MKCGICGKEMKEIQAPSISVEDVKEEGNLFPIVLKCHLIRIYGCEDCPVRATYSETKDYVVKEITNCNDNGCQDCTECEDRKTLREYKLRD